MSALKFPAHRAHLGVWEGTYRHINLNAEEEELIPETPEEEVPEEDPVDEDIPEAEEDVTNVDEARGNRATTASTALAAATSIPPHEMLFHALRSFLHLCQGQVRPSLRSRPRKGVPLR